MYNEQFIKSVGLPQMESAGGLIVNDSGSVLFIMKGGRLDLPKGRVEGSASREETALREVVEETSIESDLLTIISPLCQTFHLTSYGNNEYIKKTKWFVMEYTGSGASLKPQLEEGITDCRWIHPDSFKIFKGAMRPRIYYVCSLWKKLFFERGIHKILLNKATG